MDKKDHLVKWEDVCRPKVYGDLGIGLLKEKNSTLLTKWLGDFPMKIAAYDTPLFNQSMRWTLMVAIAREMLLIPCIYLGNTFFHYFFLMLGSRLAMGRISDFGKTIGGKVLFFYVPC